MPKKTLTDHQVKIYMNLRKDGKNQTIAAAKSGFSERSARRIDSKEHCSFKKKKHDWKTRKDPFEYVWENKVLPLLRNNSSLQAKTLLENLQEDYPNKYPDKLLRTLQRRVQKWKIIEGPNKEIIFRQKHLPGYQIISDFTCCKQLEVSIQGELLNHLLFHSRLPFSGWEYAKVILGGESYTALSESLQEALHCLGGIPKTHRTDSLSAAYKNLPGIDKDKFTKAYEDFCLHYNLEPTRNNRGEAHENGSIESSHRHLKNRLDQALILRGSRNFDSLNAYRLFVSEIIERHNKRLRAGIEEEIKSLQPLPIHKTVDFSELTLNVTTSSTIRVKDVVYSVPSRLIGSRLKVHLYDDRFDLFLGSTHVETMTRARRDKNKGRKISVDYRHLIHSLVRKPMAFRRFIFQEAMFPSYVFKKTWNLLDQMLDERTACKEYVKILYIASKNEEGVGKILEKILEKGQIPRLKDLEEKLEKTAHIMPEISINQYSLRDYDELIKGDIA